MAKNTLKVMGASNHCDEERSKLDYYGTDPRSTKALLEVEKFDNFIWEPAAGHHLITKVLEEAGYEVMSTDVADYGFGDEKVDFLSLPDEEFHEKSIKRCKTWCKSSNVFKTFVLRRQ